MRKPICRRCTARSLECVFPRREESTSEATTQRQRDLDVLPDESSNAGDSMRFTLSTASPTYNNSFSVVKVSIYDSITERFQSAFFNTPPRIPTYEIPKGFYDRAGSSLRSPRLPLFRTPRPIHDDLIPFFLSYHKENINYGRYFWYLDPHEFIRNELVELSKQSEPLQYAIAAFSALIYSIQHDVRMKRFTFLFYAKAIQGLQQVINSDSMTSEAAVYTTVAIILELASVDVRLPFTAL
jgi:hypothetical protein